MLFRSGGASWKEKTGFWLNIVAIIAGLSSYGIFTWGMCSTYNGFINFV